MPAPDKWLRVPLPQTQPKGVHIMVKLNYWLFLPGVALIIFSQFCAIYYTMTPTEPANTISAMLGSGSTWVGIWVIVKSVIAPAYRHIANEKDSHHGS